MHPAIGFNFPVPRCSEKQPRSRKQARTRFHYFAATGSGLMCLSVKEVQSETVTSDRGGGNDFIVQES